MVHYRRERNIISDELNTSLSNCLNNKVANETVFENSQCPVLKIKSLGLHSAEMEEPDVNTCLSSASFNNVITDEEWSSSLEKSDRQSEEDATSCSLSSDDTNGTSSSPREQPSEVKQEEEKVISFLDEREEDSENFSQKKCFSVPNSKF